jgi:hypothetical protein
MKKLIILFFVLSLSSSFAQEHFGGISTSKRVGITNIANNPSELANLSSKFEVQLLGTSINFGNSKIGYKDIVGGSDLKKLLFKDKDPINLSINSEISGPSFAIKLLGFGFAITSKANVKADLINIDPTLANALTNGSANNDLLLTTLTNSSNQRMNATVWGEVGLSAAHAIYKSDNHKINAGVTFKLLFPGAYTNVGVALSKGQINNNFGSLELKNATANINIAYAGSLANNFNDVNNYTKSLYGALNGFSGDVGVDYQFKPDGKDYRLKLGAALKNYGSMTYKASNNESMDYNLSVQGAQVLRLNQFQNVKSLTEIENILIANNNNGSINFNATNTKKDFKVNLPTVINLYADVKIISKLNITVFAVQKVNQSNGNDQIAAYNSLTITPRINIGPFEAFIPLNTNELSGTNTGLGFRLGGFYVGSNSAVSAVLANTKQIDFYTGFRFGFL